MQWEMALMTVVDDRREAFWQKQIQNKPVVRN